MLRSIRKKLAKLWYKLVTLKSSPRKIALGFAVGVFISYTPTFGVQTVMALGVAALLRLNPIATAAGTYVTNIVTAPPLYMLCHEVGRVLLGMQAASVDLTETKIGWNILRLGKVGLQWMGVELLGAVVVGAITAVPAYFLALFGVIGYRRARLNRRIQKMRQRIEQAESRPSRKPGAAPGSPAAGRHLNGKKPNA